VGLTGPQGPQGIPGSADSWSRTGNAGTTASHFLGTTDARPLEFRVNNRRGLRIEHASQSELGESVNVIGGHAGNFVESGVAGATIGGGGFANLTNRVSGDGGTIGGGTRNVAAALYSTVGGGDFNIASGVDATIGGGSSSTAHGFASTVGGGFGNSAGGLYATVPGGANNRADGDYTVAFGYRARADHRGSLVWGDYTEADFGSTGDNQFLIRATGGVGIGTNDPQGAALRVAGTIRADSYIGNGAGLTGVALTDMPNLFTGIANTFDGRVGIGHYPGAPLDVLGLVQVRENGVIRSIPVTYGGSFNGMLESYYADNDRYGIAQLPNGITAIYTSKSFGPSSIQLGQMTGIASFSAQVTITHAGNVGIGTEIPASKLQVAGEARATFFTPTSDRNAKENFTPVDPADVLRKVAALPITEWSYRSLGSTRHMGPVAQDFHAAFGLGADDKGISTVDADGVALAAIQALNRKVEEKDARIRELEQRMERLERLLNTSTSTPPR
jgi:hypothetical protein